MHVINRVAPAEGFRHVEEAVIIGVALPKWRERPVLVAARDCAISCAP